jgi:hypothetical protein
VATGVSAVSVHDLGDGAPPDERAVRIVERVQRSAADMATALGHHVTLLSRYIAAAKAGDPLYLGEIAGKLRLLVITKGGNKPLLLRFAELAGDELMIALEEAPIPPLPGHAGVGDAIDIGTFLDLVAVALQIPDSGGELIPFSHREFVTAWAQQYGAAHEDWGLPETSGAGVAFPVRLGGSKAHALTLLRIADAIHRVAGGYLAQLTDEKIAAAEVELRRRGGRRPPA